MRSETRKLALAALLAVVGAGGQRLGWAEAADAAPAAAAGGELKEVVVTAERRTERLMDVPMSVTAIGSEAIEVKGLHNIDDLTRVAPGVTFLRNGMSSSGNYNDEDSDISIRGIDSTAGASTTGIYIDDTPIQTRHLNFGTVNPFPALFDLDRVEVLKGPQGTLFGSGSMGGTLRFITPTPGLTQYSGFAKAEYDQIDGGGQNYEIGAAVGGPIIDGVLGFRISASWREDGGWVDRVNYIRPTPVSPPPTCNPGCFGFPVALYTTIPEVTNTLEANSNWHDTQTFRAALRWAPSENLTIDPSYYVQTLHINDTGAYWLNISNPADNVYRSGNAQRNPSTDPWYVAALKIDWHEPWADIVSNTSYFSRQQHSVSDYTQWISTVFLFNQYPPEGDTSSAYFTDHQDNFTQEIRFSSVDASSRLQWTAGLFYLHAHENSTEFIHSADVCPVPADCGPNNLAYSQPEFSMVDKQVAVFGELTYKFSQLFSATAGLRYSKLDYTGVVKEQQFGLFGNQVVDTTSSGTNKPVTPRFVLNYTPDPDSLYYASAAKGFRVGGINSQLPPQCGLPTVPGTFAPDSLWQYEIGAKNTLLDHHLQVSTALYYIDWKNIQQFVYLTCGLGFDFNLGDATGKGGEIQVDWRATQDLTLGLIAAYTETSYNDTVSIPGIPFYDQIVAKGDHIQASPWNLDFNAEYVWNRVNRHPYVRIDYQFATAQTSLVPFQNPANAPNSDPTLPGLPEIRIFDARGGLRFGGLDLSLFVHNAFNFHTPIFVSRDLATTAGNGYVGVNGEEVNFVTNYFGRGYVPRTFGVTTTYRF